MSKMIKCKTCGAEIASSAKTCPSCGAKNKKPFYTNVWFWIIIIIVVAAIGGGSKSGSTDSKSEDVAKTSTDVSTEQTVEESKTPEEEVIAVSAIDLAKAFDDNEINANNLYKDKMLEVTGTVADIGEVLGSTYITLEAGEEFAITQTQCTFKDKDQIAKVAELSKGDTVTLVGKCDGKSMNVTVSNCKFK